MRESALPAIILVAPQMGENIGAAARVMKNFGLSDLRIVAPRDGWPNPLAMDMASGAAELVEHAKLFATLEEAIADLSYIYAVTARQRDMVKPVAALGQDSLRAGAGFVFGRERIGLTNDEVVLADCVLTIPTNPGFSSLNLAQSVAVVCYEVASKPKRGALTSNSPASKAELIGLLEHLEAHLDRLNAYANVDEKKPVMVRNLRNMFTRAGLTSQEIQSFRGVIRVLTGTKQ